MITKRRDAHKILESMVGPLNFGRLINSLRLCEEMSLAQFSKKLGITVSHLCDIEKRRKFVSPERAAKFAKILGYSQEQFVCLALQDIIDQAGIKMKVQLVAA